MAESVDGEEEGSDEGEGEGEEEGSGEGEENAGVAAGEEAAAAELSDESLAIGNAAPAPLGAIAASGAELSSPIALPLLTLASLLRPSELPAFAALPSTIQMVSMLTCAKEFKMAHLRSTLALALAHFHPFALR